MTPYYQQDGITIYHGDCLVAREWIAADVLVTDPPYGMSLRCGWWSRDNAIAGDHSTQARDAVLDLWGTQKSAAVFGTWRVARPPGLWNVLVWDKSDGVGSGMGDLRQGFGFTHEEIYLFGMWPKNGKRHGSVLRTSHGMRALAVKMAHPTPKPVAIVALLLSCAQPGVVADPFAGSGSTLVAAKMLGRSAIGIEIEERYCEIAARRLSQGVLDIFGEATA